MAAALVAVLSYGGLIAISLYGTVERSTAGVVTRGGQDVAPDQEAVSPPAETADTEDEDRAGIVLLRFAVLMGVPALALLIALLAPTRRSAGVARSAAAVVLAAMTLLMITTVLVGLGFAVATGLMLTAAIKTADPDHDMPTDAA